MKKTQAAIYYNNEKGYLFFPFGVSKNALPLEKSEFNKNLALEISGTKSQTKFNNLYKYLLCEEKDHKLFLIDKEEKKEYVFEKEDIVGLGKQVSKILSQGMNSNDKVSLVLKTVNENIVIYTRPSDDFEDAGDRHTDVWKIN